MQPNLPEEQTAPAQKTREEVETLKQQWILNPSGNLATTPGYKAFQDELAIFQDRIINLCQKIQCNIGVSYYLITIETEIETLRNQVQELSTRLVELESHRLIK